MCRTGAIEPMQLPCGLAAGPERYRNVIHDRTSERVAPENVLGVPSAVMGAEVEQAGKAGTTCRLMMDNHPFSTGNIPAAVTLLRGSRPTE